MSDPVSSNTTDNEAPPSQSGSNGHSHDNKSGSKYWVNSRIFDGYPVCHLPKMDAFPFGQGRHDENGKEISPIAVKVEPYFIGKYPVTNGDFKVYLMTRYFEDNGHLSTEENSKWGILRGLGVNLGDISEIKKLFNGLVDKNHQSLMRAVSNNSNFLITHKDETYNQTLSCILKNQNLCNHINQTMKAQWDQEYPHFLSKDFGHDDQPMVNVPWKEAVQFSQWLGGALPTEVQWEYAARFNQDTEGKQEFTTYPWGNDQPTWDRANLLETSLGVDKNLCTTKVTEQLCGKNPAGLYHLCGNVWEWCFDQWHPDIHVALGGGGDSHINYPKGSLEGDKAIFYVKDTGLSSSAEKTHCAVVLNADDKEQKGRVVRGGAFDSLSLQGRVIFRRFEPWDERKGNVGFRVVFPNILKA